MLRSGLCGGRAIYWKRVLIYLVAEDTSLSLSCYDAEWVWEHQAPPLWFFLCRTAYNWNTFSSYIGQNLTLNTIIVNKTTLVCLHFTPFFNCWSFSSTVARLHCGRTDIIWITIKAFRILALQWHIKPFRRLHAVFICIKYVVSGLYGWREADRLNIPICQRMLFSLVD